MGVTLRVEQADRVLEGKALPRSAEPWMRADLLIKAAMMLEI